MSEKFIKSKLFFGLVAMVAGLLTAVGIWAATTIGPNMNTDGNLTVYGAASIKNPTPSFDLDVNGNARITNDLYLGGTGDLDTTGNLQHDGTDFVFSTVIKPTGYKSSDGTAGSSTSVSAKSITGASCTLFFSDGLLRFTDCPVL